MEDILLNYSNTNLNITVNYFTSKIIIDNIEEGNFKLNDKFLYIIWNNDNEETFIKDQSKDNILVYNLFNQDIKETNIVEELIDKNKIYNTLEYQNEEIISIKTIIDIEEIYIDNEIWNDFCIINKETNYLYRKSNIEEHGYYQLFDNKLIINWTKWSSEEFIYENGIYKKFINEILIHHKDWKDYCIISESIIYKKSNNDEKGTYTLIDNILTIYWEKWNAELFYKLDSEYYYNDYILNVEIIDDYSDLDKYFLLNIYSNKAYYKNITYIGDFIIVIPNNSILDNKLYSGNYINENITNNKIIIKLENNILEYNIIFELNQTIKLYKNLNKNITLFNNYKQYATIDITNNIIKCNDLDKKGTYIFDISKNNSLYSNLKINWVSDNLNTESYTLYDNLNTESYTLYDNLNTESYTLYDNIYFLSEYYNLNNKDIYLFIDNNYIIFKINLLESYLYNDTIKIKFIYNNNIFHLFNINNIFHLSDTNNNYINNFYLKTINEFNILSIKHININIYINFNNIKNNDILQLYTYFYSENIKKENNIYSIETFLNRYKYFNIDLLLNKEYKNDNNKYNDKYSNDDKIINWYNNNLTNKTLFSKLDSIEYCYIPDSFNEKDKNLYIINLEDNNNLENIVDNISKISNIILIYNINNLNNLKIFDYLLFLKNYFKHIIIIKINQINNYSLIKDIFISIDNNLLKYIERVIYVVHNIQNFDDIVLNSNNYENDKLYLISKNKYIKYTNFIEVIDYIYDELNIYEIIIIIIFYYLINSKILYNNLICNISKFRNLIW
jgi:hypothetical protein